MLEYCVALYIFFNYRNECAIFTYTAFEWFHRVYVYLSTVLD